MPQKILQVANQVLITESYPYGLGIHDADLQLPDQFVQVLKWNWIATAPGMAVSVLAPVSI